MLTPPPLPSDPGRRKSASEIMAVNLSVPGLGTIQAGQKLVGWIQLILAVGGVLMTSYFAGWFLLEWKKTGVFPLNMMAQSGFLPPHWKKPIIAGLGGVVVFLAALGWAVLSSLALRRSQERH